jgi:hypothetical protein
MKKEQESTSRSMLAAWRARSRLRLQVLALAVALAAPFGLYWALAAGVTAAAAVFFACTVTSMILAFWVG